MRFLTDQDVYAEKELNRAFVVVEPGRYRFRKLRHSQT